ncbi:MAG: hypothetical protein JRN67_10635, partial [Nitrososphaerota archaeon]|nr:hypothetical protein [Nitrososphaerota archaeon]
TKDSATVRVYVVAFTIGRINSSRKHEIRIATSKIISERAQAMVYEQFAQEAVKQNLSRELYESCKDIAKIRHLGIRKIKLINAGEGMPYVPTPVEREDESEDLEEVEEGVPEIAAA